MAEVDQTETKPETLAKERSYRLILFVAGNELNSENARKVLASLCEQRFKDHYEIQIIDVFEDFQSAITHQVTVVPTVILETPTKRTIIVGSLRDSEKVLIAFDSANGEAP